MTIQEFNNTSFGKGDTAIYKKNNIEYLIKSIDFEEQLIGLLIPIDGAVNNEITWVRCENIYFKPVKW